MTDNYVFNYNKNTAFSKSNSAKVTNFFLMCNNSIHWQYSIKVRILHSAKLTMICPAKVTNFASSCVTTCSVTGQYVFNKSNNNVFVPFAEHLLVSNRFVHFAEIYSWVRDLFILLKFLRGNRFVQQCDIANEQNNLFSIICKISIWISYYISGTGFFHLLNKLLLMRKISICSASCYFCAIGFFHLLNKFFLISKISICWISCYFWARCYSWAKDLFFSLNKLLLRNRFLPFAEQVVPHEQDFHLLNRLLLLCKMFLPFAEQVVPHEQNFHLLNKLFLMSKTSICWTGCYFWVKVTKKISSAKVITWSANVTNYWMVFWDIDSSNSYYVEWVHSVCKFDFISYAKVNAFILMKNHRIAVMDNWNVTVQQNFTQMNSVHVFSDWMLFGR